ncbi:methyltransferase family protein [Sciscionella marina]|uniref:methyltransferase family protein n=1 Tax=Sciscionella marina TaxID=508770 RepID=UPI0003A09867|nr:methyltransferase dimerization domain-containing protein [Sciscionella marina]
MATPATPERIVDIATGYMGARQLFAAARIGLFRALDDGPHTVAELAEATGKKENVVRVLADSMNGLGLLDRDAGRYRLAADAAEFLSGKAETDLHPFLNFLAEISYGHWSGFDTTVDTGQPVPLAMDEDRSAAFLSGVMRYNALHARVLAECFDFRPYRELLDFGGLSPSFTIAALRANPALSARLVFAEEFTAELGTALEQAGLTGRARVEPAATETARPGGEHDLVLLNHVVHRFDAERNRAILAAARGAARPGARLVLLDFFLDEDERQRPVDALHAGEYLVIDGTVVYPESVVAQWLEETGWRRHSVLALPGSPRAVLAEAV